MAAVVLPWNPDEFAWPGVYARDVGTVRRTGVLRLRWELPVITADDGVDLWLVVVGDHPSARGLIGHGVVRGSTPLPGTSVVRADIDMDLLLPQGDQVPLAQLLGRLPGLDTTGVSAVALTGPAEVSLRELWAESNAPEPGTLDPVPGALPSDHMKRVPVSAFERDPELRRRAIANGGSACHACGLDLELAYGAAGADLVQVHHITPLAHITPGYEIDPLVDLVPLCPTCHAVAHGRWPDPYSIEDIRTMLRSRGFLRGTIATAEQLEAEAAAARILGA